MAYLLAIGSAVLYGAADFMGGLASRRAGTILVVLVSQAGGLAALALVLLLLPPAAPSRPDMLWGACAGLTGGIGVALLYRALAIGTMAVVAPTTAVCAVAIPVLASFLRGENPTALALTGIAVGIGSIVLVSQQQAPSPVRRSGVGTALASGVFIGLFFLSLAKTGPDAGMWPLIAARAVSVALFGAVALASGQRLRAPRAVTAMAIAGGVIDMAANALYMLAARQGPLSLVVTLSSLYPASTVLLARMVLGERLRALQVTGVVCALVAVVLIVSGGP